LSNFVGGRSFSRVYQDYFSKWYRCTWLLTPCSEIPPSKRMKSVLIGYKNMFDMGKGKAILARLHTFSSVFNLSTELKYLFSRLVPPKTYRIFLSKQAPGLIRPFVKLAIFYHSSV
jgi:hypothetical protein